MFRSLDALIGFATVMLVLSLVVTVLTQLVANFLKLRGQHLRHGVLQVFLQLGWEFAGERAKALAREIVSGKDAITREDLIENLLALAQNTPELKNQDRRVSPRVRSPGSSGPAAPHHARTFRGAPRLSSGRSSQYRHGAHPGVRPSQ